MNPPGNYEKGAADAGKKQKKYKTKEWLKKKILIYNLRTNEEIHQCSVIVRKRSVFPPRQPYSQQWCTCGINYECCIKGTGAAW